MILTDEAIIAAQETGSLKIDPFDRNQVQAASYDFRVGNQVVTTSSGGLINMQEKGFAEIKAGDFGFVITLEKIELDNQHTARFGLRSKFARKGLIATIGMQIDPGFAGCLIVGVSNLTPNSIIITHRDDFLSLEFHRLETPVKKVYSGPFQDIYRLRPEDIEMVTEKKGMPFSEMQQTLASLSHNVGAMKTEIKSMKWILGIGLAFFGLLIATVGLIDKII